MTFRTANLEGVQRSLVVDDVPGAWASATYPRDPAPEGDWSTVMVTLHGPQDRQVHIRCVVPAPVWRTSYRVLCDGHDGLELVGYAMIENATADDWDDVRLTLASTLALPAPRSARWAPENVEVDDGSVEREIPMEVVLAEVQREAPATMGRIRRSAPARMRGVVAAEEAEMAAAQREPVFRRELPFAVSVPRGHAVQVPMLHESLAGALVALYDEKLHPTHPLLAVRMENSTDLPLEPGPATIYRHGEYAGDSTLRALAPGELCLLPFAVEAGCTVATTFGTASEEEQDVTAGRGYLYHTTWTRSLTTYTLRNTSARDLTVYIEHPADRHTEYVGEPSPISRGEVHDRFAAEVAAGDEVVFVVTQRRRRTETVWVTPDQIHEQVALVERLGKAELVGRLRDLVENSDAITAHRHERAVHDDEIARITKQQSRIRRNLEALGRDSGAERTLRDQYASSLSEDEQRLKELHASRQDEDGLVQAEKRRFKEQAGLLLEGSPLAALP